MGTADKRVVAVFITVQVVIAGALLGVRWADEGAHPFREYPLSWQMYSATECFLGRSRQC